MALGAVVEAFDILGLGVTAIDDLLFVPAYPPPDSKVHVRRVVRQCGGLTATALVAAARLGARCAFAGILGDDDLSRYVLRRLEEEGIDTAHVCRRPCARPVHSVIVVDELHKTRTIFADAAGAGLDEPLWPAEDVLRSARVLFVDHVGVERMIYGSRIARGAGLPVVADLENDEHPRFAELLALVDHLIVSRAFARKLTGQDDPASAARRLGTEGRQAVVVTCGAEGCWYLGAGGKAPRHQPAFPVEVVDTTGCGDVFHGAYAAALAQGVALPDRVRFAAAAAALKATQPGGQAGIPTRPIVEAFLAGDRDLRSRTSGRA